MQLSRLKARLSLLAALVVLVVCMAIIITGSFYRGDLRAALPGTVAPNLSLIDSDNQRVSLADLRGNVVVVCFSASKSSQSDGSTGQSGTDQTESPDLASLADLCRDLGDAPDLKVLEIREDRAAAAAPAEQGARALANEYPSVHFGLDPTGTIARRYDVDRIAPTYFVIDRQGVIRYRGSFSQGNALANQLTPSTHLDSMHPVTDSHVRTSCTEVVETLLSSSATSLATPASDSF